MSMMVQPGRFASGAALAISGTPVLTTTEDEPYAGFTVSATGGTPPYTFSVFSGTLPTGITLNSSTGAVSGTPTTAGTSTGIVIRVTDDLGATDDLASFDLEVQAAVAAGTLNPADKSANITLSGGDLTATKSGGGGAWSSVRSETSHSSGKYYFEWTAVEFSGSFVAGGFANATASLANFIGADANGIILLTNGQVFKSGGASSTLAAVAEGNIIGLAIDLDNDLFWCRNGAGNWNGSATANPATATEGIALPSGLTSGDVFAGLSLATAPTDQVIANLGATAFSQAAPSGFSDWG